MANIRVYDDVEDLTINSVNVGGVTSIAINQDYVDTARSETSGYGSTTAAQGPEAVGMSGERTTLSFATSDVTQMVDLLKSTPGEVSWHGHESGAATYGTTTIAPAAPGNAAVLVHSASLSFSRGAYGVLSFDAIVRTDGAEGWSDYIKYVDAAVAPTLNPTARLWKPLTVTHTAVSITQIMSMDLTVTGRVLEDYSSDGVGVIADLAGWSSVTGNFVTREQDESAELGYDLGTKAMELAFGATSSLAVSLEGVGESVAQTLTILNVHLTSRARTGGHDWTGNSYGFEAQWRDPTTPWAERTLDAAVATDRLINFAAT